MDCFDGNPDLILADATVEERENTRTVRLPGAVPAPQPALFSTLVAPWEKPTAYSWDTMQVEAFKFEVTSEQKAEEKIVSVPKKVRIFDETIVEAKELKTFPTEEPKPAPVELKPAPVEPEETTLEPVTPEADLSVHQGDQQHSCVVQRTH
jgi:hypothetical protein